MMTNRKIAVVGLAAAILLGLSACSTGQDQPDEEDDPLVSVVEAPDAGSGEDGDESTTSEGDDTGGDDDGSVDNHTVLAGDPEDFPKEDADVIVDNASAFWVDLMYLSHTNEDPYQWLDAVKPHVTDDYFEELASVKDEVPDPSGSPYWQDFLARELTTNVEVTNVEVALDQEFDAENVTVRVFGSIADQTPTQKGDVVKVGAALLTEVQLEKQEDGQWLVTGHKTS